MNIPMLMTRWFELFPNASEAARTHSFNELRELHDQRGRYYHVFVGHIGFMIEARMRFFPDAGDEVDKAIFGHDIIYDARRQDNEERSAVAMAAIQRSLGDTGHQIMEVGRLILVTQKHQPRPGDIAAEQLCDLDLISLGLPAAKYQANTALIRKEHAHASDTEWAGRERAFIDGLLAREFIYRTPAIRAEYEAAARRNLAAERAALAV